MQLKRLLTDDEAVSPVIGVILMVAITVILAAVIGTFVLGLGDQVQNTSPQASFNFDFDDGSGGSDVLTITHDGGDSITASQLFVASTQPFRQGDGNTSTGTTATRLATTIGSTTTGYTQSGDVTAGNSISITAAGSDELNDATVRMVWEGQSGDQTATLGKWDGPDA